MWGLKKSTLILLGINLVGLVICLMVNESIVQGALMEERDYDFGDSLTSMMYIEPIMWLCFFMDAIWSIVALIAVVKRREYQGVVACAVVFVVWVSAYAWTVHHDTLPPSTWERK